jgi:PAS domain S-box-containing protein
VLGGVPLLTAPYRAWRPSRPATPWAIEIASLSGALLLVAGIVFGRPLSADGDPALALLFVPFMIAATLALRGGLFVSSLAILGLALAAAMGTALSLGPFASSSVHFGLLALWGYIVTLSGTTMLICALVDELALSQKRLMALFAHAHDGLLLLDASGRILEANPAAARLLGIAEAALPGTPLWRLEPDASPQASALGRWLAELQVGKGEPTRLHVGPLLRSDGSRFDAEIEFARYADSSGAQHAHAVFRDISERLRAEADRRKAEAAERANRAKTEFLSRMSHELRTPLNAVLGFAQLLERDAAGLAPQQRLQVDHITGAGKHLLSLIDEVLDLSRIEAGAVSVQLAPTDLRHVANDALQVLRTLAEARGVVLEGPAAPAGPADAPHAWADATRLQEVLINLLDNAIKYTARGGRVWLRLHDDGGTTSPVAVEVGDSGRGISAEQQEHLFEPFNRLGAERSDVDGTGIGLVISRRLVDLMQGRLRVQSEPGAGSVFCVELPRATAGAVTSPPAPVARASTSATNALRHVLYVEDDEVNALLVQAMLATRPDLHLSIAATGAEGLSCARHTRPDLVLIDMHLPDATGIEVLHSMRAMPGLQRVPCIAASADAMPETIAGARAAGFDAYLTKPLALDQFIRCIDLHLDAGPPAEAANAPAEPAAAPAGAALGCAESAPGSASR